MSNEGLGVLFTGIFVVAFLYSSVGHAGASGYIAVMSLLSIPVGIYRPSALILNILVASIASYQFWRAGHFSWKLFKPFALLAIPLAFWAGTLELPAPVLKKLVGLVLLASAARFLVNPKETRLNRLLPFRSRWELAEF